MLIRVLRYRGRAPDILTEAEFTEAGGTIGRSSECTLTLPDPERHVSRVQAEINWSDGRFLLLGRGAANPIERNGEPVAAGQSAALNDGDELHIGDYVLRAEFQQTRTEASPEPFSEFPTQRAGDSGAGDAESVETKPAPAPVSAPAARTLPGTEVTQLNMSSRRAGFAPVHAQPAAMAGDGLAERGQEPYQVCPTSPASTTAFRSWDNPEGTSQTVIVGRSAPRASLANRDAAAAPTTAVESAARIADLVHRAAHAHRQDFVAIPKSRTTGFLQELNRKVLDAKLTAGERVARSSPELLQALLCGAGLPDLPMSELDEETMLRIGALLRSFAQGFVELLATRATIKSEMRAEMTIMSSEGNNPLKFSPDAAAALEHLLTARAARGYLKPEDAVRDAVNDLIAHQSGVMAGMRALLQELLLRLSPETLETRLASHSVLDSMLPMNRKAKLWELFEEIYADVSREAQNEIEAMSGRAFVQAYEAQIKRLEERDRR